MFRTFEDYDLNGRCFVVDSMKDVAEHLKETGPLNPTGKMYLPRAAWIGMKMESWEDMPNLIKQPWKVGQQRMAAMLEEIKESIPTPVSVRRRGRWSEEDGEVCPDRALAGEADFYRRVVRQNMAGPRNVALLCQVGGLADKTEEQMFWRGAAAAALADLLEEAGYSCEVWTWNVATGTYTSGCKDSFYCCKVKSCGEPLDTMSMIAATSAWYYRGMVLNAKASVGRPSGGLGYTSPSRGGFEKYMDITQGIQKVEMANVWTKAGAISTAKSMLADITKGQEATV